MIKFIKKLFCKHDYILEFKVKGVQQNIWKCKKCNQRYLQHYGLHLGYKLKDFEIYGFDKEREDEKKT